jgi:serine/threonine protein kinase
MTTGHPPFTGQSESLLFKAICQKKPPIRANFSSNFKKIIFDLLEKNPTKRLGSLRVKQRSLNSA